MTTAQNITLKPNTAGVIAFEVHDANASIGSAGSHRIGTVILVGKRWHVDPVGKSSPRDTYKTRDLAVEALIAWMA